MLKGFFSAPKSILPPPPKNQIEVACPACGAAQYEPKMVVSTFCKSCGVHLSIHKKKVTASTVTRSGAVGVNDLWEKALPPGELKKSPEPAEAVAAPVESASPPSAATPQADLPAAPPTAEESVLPGFGAFLQAVSPSPATVQNRKPPETHSSPPASLAARSHLEPLPPASPVPPPNSTLEKMKSQGAYRQQYFKDIECFECHHVFKVSRSMKSADCTECGASICIEDLDINQHVTEPILTRGDVVIRKLGVVTAPFIECRDLRCLGTLDAEVRCQNEALFRTEGTIKGSLTCRKLTIEKGADITFLGAVRSGDIQVNASVTGTLHATGKIIIGPHGAVHGDVTARAVAIEPGGELNGAMNIVRSSATPAA